MSFYLKFLFLALVSMYLTYSLRISSTPLRTDWSLESRRTERNQSNKSGKGGRNHTID